MTNNTPDYEDNLAFESQKTAGTIEPLTKDGKTVAIRCYVDDVHYFDLSVSQPRETMDWYDAKLWCEQNYCRLPMKHEWGFIIKNIKKINKMLEKAGGDVLDKDKIYWSSSEYSSNTAWAAYLDHSGLPANGSKGYAYSCVLPVLTF